MDKVLLLSAIGVGVYLYTNPDAMMAVSGGCPEGFVRSGDDCLPDGGDGCPVGFAINDAGTLCLPNDPCGEGMVLSLDGKSCISKDKPCGDGFVLKEEDGLCHFDGNPCEDDCLKYDELTDLCNPIPGCGTKTGSEVGDMALDLGVSLASGVVMDAALQKVLNNAENRAARKAALDAANKSAASAATRVEEKAAKEAVQKLAQEEAKKAIQTKAQQEATELLGKRTSGIVQKQTAKEVATIAARKLGAKVAAQAARLATLSSTGIGAILGAFTALAMSLQIGLAASNTYFEKDSPNDKAWDDIDSTLRAFLEAIPFWGDMASIVGTFMAFKTGCPRGMEEKNLLCYDPPKPGFNCEAFLCYANASAYPSPMEMSPGGESLAFMTKKVLTDTGTIPDVCPPGMEHGRASALCYESKDWATAGITAGTAWEACLPGMVDTGDRCEDVYPIDIGRLRNRKGCGDFPWITNCRDDGTSLWSDWRCNTWCDGNWDWNDGGYCHTRCGGEGKIVKAAWDLAYCPPDKEEIDLLCYEKCRPGFYHVPGMPYLCSRSYQKRRETLTPHGNVCPSNKRELPESLGLCYLKDEAMPPSYRRTTLGLMAPTCPQDRPEWFGYENFNPTSDSPVTCKKATYTRKPMPLFSIYAMKKVTPEEPAAEPLPPLCSSLPTLKAGEQSRLCREDTPAGFDITEDGTKFFKKCDEGYSFYMTDNTCVTFDNNGNRIAKNNAEGVREVQYNKV